MQSLMRYLYKLCNKVILVHQHHQEMHYLISVWFSMDVIMQDTFLLLVKARTPATIHKAVLIKLHNNTQ